MSGPLNLDVFLQEGFSAQAYANAIIEGRGGAPILEVGNNAISSEKGRKLTNGVQAPGSPTSTRLKVDIPEDSVWRAQLSPQAKTNAVESDVSFALSQLNIALDDVGRLIKEEISASSSKLIHEAKDAIVTEKELASLCDKVTLLQESTRVMKKKVTEDYDQLQTLDRRIRKLYKAADLIRKSLGFVLLCRRLQAQLKACIPSYAQGATDGSMSTVAETPEESAGGNESGELPKAASTLKALEDTISASETDSEESFTKLAFVQTHLEQVKEARTLITEHMEELVVQGLKELSPTLLGESLQTALNLGGLPELVQDLLNDLTDVVRERTHHAFDAAALGREISSRSTSRTPFGSSYLSRRAGGDGQQLSQQEFQRFSASAWKRIQTLLLHEMPAVCKKVYTLEKVLSLKTVDGQGTTLLQQTLPLLGDKPSLLFWKTFSDALEKDINIAVRESQPFQRVVDEGYPQLLALFKDFFSRVALYTDSTYNFDKQTPETVMLVGRLGALSSGYVARVSARLDDSIATAFSSRNIPGYFEGQAFGQLVAKELEAVRDPLLLPTLLTAVDRAVEAYADQVVSLRAETALHLAPGQISSSHLRNADLASALYSVINTLRTQNESNHPAINAFCKQKLPKFEHMLHAYFLEPFLQACKEQLKVPILRMQYSNETLNAKTPSPYMTDLSDRMAALRDLILPKYSIGETRNTWVTAIASDVLYSFTSRHDKQSNKAKIQVSPRFSADHEELEFSLSQLLSSLRARKTLRLSDCAGYDLFAQLRK